MSRRQEQRQQGLERRPIGAIGRIGRGLWRPGMKMRALFMGLTSVWALWAVTSTAGDRFAESRISRMEAIEGRTLREFRGEEEGLQQAEILGARAVSRSLFAAQRAERREAEAAGMMGLVPALRRVQQTLQRLRAVELEAAMPRAKRVAESVVEQAEDGGAAAEPDSEEADRVSDGTPSGDSVSDAARRRALREARALPFREACAGVLEEMEGLREATSRLHSARQRMLAEAVLRRLESLEPMIEQAAAAAMTADAPALEELARELGPPDDALRSAGTEPLDPTFVTRDRHRREIPRVP